MNRRAFVTGLGAVLAAPLAVEAQQIGRVYRVGIITPAARPASAGNDLTDIIAMVLREIGYIEGQNLVLVRRFADGKPERLPALARELAQQHVDVIIAVTAGAVQAAKDATATIPIVMGFATDPIGRGFVSTLAQPGRNITGVTYSPDDVVLAPKRLELIKEAVPRVARVALLTTREPFTHIQTQAAQKAASSLGIKLVVVELRDGDYGRAFAAMVLEGAGALFVAGSPILNNDRKQIIELAAQHRLPAIYEWREAVIDGGLMSYGGSLVELYRRVATYVDRIVKGANPAELPVEQPTSLALTFNLKTAKALGLTIPQSLLLRADEVIQ